MKRIYTVLFTLIVVSAVSAAPAVSEPRIEEAHIAFNIGIQDVHLAAQTGDDRNIPGDLALVVDAEIGSITIRTDTDDRFVAEVELIGGSWSGEEDISLYRAYALFDNTDFRNDFSRRSATRLSPGDKILVLCRYLGIGVDYDETSPIAVLEVISLRRLY
jgi:hypothetical protein